MAYQASISSQLSQFGSTVIDFNLVDDGGLMPSVRTSYKWRGETVTSEQIETAKSELATKYKKIYDDSQILPPNYYQIMQQALDGYVGPGTYDAIRKALKDVDSELVSLNGNIDLDVTYPVVTDPEDIETSLKDRVDAELGAGKFDAVKAVLKGMGISSVSIKRKSDIKL